MAKETVFRKSLFGGFDRKQVIEYITLLSANCPDPATRDDILKLQKYISELEELIKKRNRTIESLNKKIEQTQTTANQVPESILAIQAIVNTHKRVQSANNELNSITESIRNTIDERKPKINSMLAKISEINEQIVTLQSGLKAVSSKLSQIDFDSIAVNEEFPSPRTVPEPPVAKKDAETIITEDTDDEIYTEAETPYTPLVIEYDDEDEVTGNSIDNFFIELDKLAEAKIFDLTTILDNEPDND